MNKRTFLSAAAALIAAPALAVVTPTQPMRFLHGMEPDKFSTNILNINGEGSWSDGDGAYLWNYRAPINGAIQINMLNVGLNGRDQGSAPTTGTDWYLYLCANPATGHQGAVLSRSITYGGVAFPSGYTSVRKLPFGFIWNAGWDGIPDFHYPANGGIITLTGSEYSSLWHALAAGRAMSWTDVNLAPWIPDNARMAYLDLDTRDGGVGGAGSAYVRSYGGQPGGVLAGSTSPTQQFCNQSRLLRITSDRKIQYVMGGGSVLYIRVAGYVMTEPS